MGCSRARGVERHCHQWGRLNAVIVAEVALVHRGLICLPHSILRQDADHSSPERLPLTRTDSA